MRVRHYRLLCAAAALALCMSVLSVFGGLTAAADSESSHKKKIVAVVYDDSGSMDDVKTANAKYAMQTLIGTLDGGDELYIVAMNKHRGGQYYAVDLKGDRTAAYAAAEKKSIFEPNGDTPSSSVRNALEVLKSKGLVTTNEAAASDANGCEYWLVIMTDGDFNDMNTINVIRQAIGYSDLHVEYLSIGSKAKQVGSDQLNSEMIFMGHHAENASGIVDAMQKICCEITGRYPLNKKYVLQSGKDIEIDLSGCDFTAAGVCVIVQDSGTSLSGAAYNGKSVTPSAQCLLQPDKNNTGVDSGDTTTLTGPFTGGTLKLSYRGSVKSAAVTVLIEPALRIEAYAEQQGKTVTASDIRHLMKPGDRICIKYRLLDSRTGKELQADKLFSDLDTSVGYAGRQYKVGETFALEEGKNYATVYVSCMGGSYVLTDSIYCNVHRNPNDFAITEQSVETAYQGDVLKTRINYAIICDGQAASVSRLNSYHYLTPTAVLRDSRGNTVPNTVTVKEENGQLYAVVDLSSVQKPDDHYTLVLTSVTDSTVPAAEADSLSVTTVIEANLPSPSSMTVSAVSAQGTGLTQVVADFTVTSGGTPVPPASLASLGCTYDVTVKDSSGKTLQPISVEEKSDSLRVTVDLSGTADGWCEAVMTVSGSGKTASGKTEAAVSYKSRSITLKPVNMTPSDAPLGSYLVSCEVIVDGQTIKPEALKAAWLSLRVTAADGQVTGDAGDTAFSVNTEGCSSVNTEAAVTLVSETRADAGAAVGAASCRLLRPAIDASRVTIKAGSAVSGGSHTVSRVGFSVTLDGEPLTPARMTYLGLGWSATASVKDGETIPVNAFVDDAAGEFCAELDTVGRNETEFCIGFTLRDDAYGRELGHTEKTITRYGFWFETEMTDSTGYGAEVTIRFRLMDHGTQVTRAGFSAYSVTVSCTDASGSSYTCDQNVEDDGTIVVTVDTKNGGVSGLGLYRVTASAVNMKNQPADNDGEARFTRVPMSLEVKADSVPRTTLNQWQMRDNTEEWVFMLLVEGEPYPFDGTWVDTTVTFNGAEVPGSLRMENGKLYFKPDGSLVGADVDGLPACGSYALAIGVKANVEPGLPCEEASLETILSVVPATYKLTALQTNDTGLDRFGSCFKREDNTAVLRFRVTRDGDALDAAELQRLLDTGAITVEKDWLRNLLFWVLFTDEITVEDKGGEGTLCVTVIRSYVPDILHFTRMLITDGDKPLTVLCADGRGEVCVSAEPSPVRLYIHWTGVTLLVIYFFIWLIGLFSFRRHLPKGYFLSVMDNGNETVSVKIKPVNTTWGDRWLWSIFCAPWNVFASQRSETFKGLTLIRVKEGGKLIVDKKTLYVTRTEVREVPQYMSLVRMLKGGKRGRQEENALKKNVQTDVFAEAVRFYGMPEKRGKEMSVDTIFICAEPDADGVPAFKYLVRFIRYQ